MRRSEPRFAAALVVGVALSWAPFARADDDPQVPFDAGRALVREGRYAEALEKFRESVALRPTPGALLNIGDCEVKLGRYASAIGSFKRAGELAEEAGQHDRVDEANDRRASIEPLVSTVTVRLEPHAKDARITVDGQPLASDIALPIDGGEHLVHASAACRLDIEQRVVVGLREDRNIVSLSLPQDPACAGERRPPPVEKPPPPLSPIVHRPLPVLSIIAGSVGVAALGASVGFGLDAAGKKSELEAACTSYPRGCPVSRRTELDATVHAADRSALVSTIALSVAVALVATSAVLYFGGRPSTRTAPTGRFAF